MREAELRRPRNIVKRPGLKPAVIPDKHCKLSIASEATAPRKNDPRKWGRLFRFGHANTKTLDREPAGRGRIGVEYRGFGPLGLERRRAAWRGWRPSFGCCRIWRAAAVFRHCAGAGLAPGPVCVRANAG